MSLDANGVGFFGKIPYLGDFVSRRLPRQFIDPWDLWLQSSMRASQDIHGDKWLSLFLVSPIWRFALSPGVCGDSAWLGLMMPSVDKVGRYYPLTLAQAVHDSQISNVFMPDSTWFAQLEAAALSALDERFDMEVFEKSLMAIQLPLPSRNSSAPSGLPDNKASYRFDLPHLAEVWKVFPSLTQALLGQFVGRYSFWMTEGVRHGQASFLCYEALPSASMYADFLKGGVNQTDSSQSYFVAQPHVDVGIMEGNEPTIPNHKSMQGIANTSLWQAFGVTEVGNRRKHNEDAMLIATDRGLWVVADGMGGHQAGDMASKLVVDSLSQLDVSDDLNAKVQWISACLKQVNHQLCQSAKQLGQGSVIGSTVVTLLASADQCAAIWAGDSRLYLLRQGQFKQLTRDHTLVDELVNTGTMTREMAVQQVGGNVITRAVGGQPVLDLDVIGFKAEQGDRYLLCSDGLDKELDEAEIANYLMADNCQAAVKSLLDAALSRNGIDNITIIVLQYG